MDYTIDLKNGKTFFHDFIYILSQTKLRKLKHYFNDNFKKKCIRPSKSFVEIPILFVFKKNDILRFCINYRDFNRITIKNRYIFLLISEILDHFAKTKYFFKIDIKKVYH